MIRIALLALFLGMGPAVAAEEPFRNSSFEEACEAAKKDGKLVLIDFVTSWCAPCKKMDKTTWKDKKVRAWLAEKTVALKIDAEKELKLAKDYRVQIYPTILLLQADGTEIDRLMGFRDAATFLSEMKDALASLADVHLLSGDVAVNLALNHFHRRVAPAAVW